ncbi:hypothetical protein NPIL_621051 [Nephila pilipes]|uniref:Uncharacterized protein n=1 Tax=Nephila pilipes TaxID=299642 RepID=A0A8X6IXC0_NEPPI|nr:hypothetical protein NPIL_621051 [Nephila pilipes]
MRVHERRQSPSRILSALCCLKKHQEPRSKSDKRRASSFSTGETSENLIFLLGFPDVGKSSFAERYESGVYTDGHKDHIERVYTRLIERTDGIKHVAKIADTPASTLFENELKVQILRGKGFLVLFAVDNAESFQEANRLLNLIQSLRGK